MILTSLSRHTRKMILVILELITLKRHQTDHGRLLRLRGNLISIEGQGRVLGRYFGGGALALCGGVIACVGAGRDLEDLGLGEGRVAGD